MVTMDNTNYEIGSHFWLDSNEQNELESNTEKWLPQAEDSCFTFSGRSAIELALLDIIRERNVTSAYLPSYCCESMVAPFIRNGIHVDFYDVDFQNGTFVYRAEDAVKHDVALVMSYFGLCADNAHSFIERLSNQGVAVIEDITHSLLSSVQNLPKSDYVIAGLRKWFAIPTGGWVGKKRGKIQLLPYKDSDPYVKNKIEGMLEKGRYISGKKSDKSRFLELQNDFEEFLDGHDRMLKIDTVSKSAIDRLPVHAIRQIRKNNAEHLYAGIQSLNTDMIQLPVMDLANDTPLFLPIFLDPMHRDSLQRHLIHHNIYCPVHWPEVDGASSGIRNNELSIICDQRYSTEDMSHIIDVIQQWKIGGL